MFKKLFGSIGMFLVGCFSAVKSGFASGGVRGAVAALTVTLTLFAVDCQAVIDTTAMDLVKADAESWIVYGVGAAIAMLGLGLGYVGARWAYKKIKGGIGAA